MLNLRFGNYIIIEVVRSKKFIFVEQWFCMLFLIKFLTKFLGVKRACTGDGLKFFLVGLFFSKKYSYAAFLCNEQRS